MPSYYYQCTSSDCGELYCKTELMKDHDINERITCRLCQSLMNQVVYPSLIHFSGTGWSNDIHGKEIIWK
jgi:predicted nucleic acid-binding Zn ribbon protein